MQRAGTDSGSKVPSSSSHINTHNEQQTCQESHKHFYLTCVLCTCCSMHVVCWLSEMVVTEAQTAVKQEDSGNQTPRKEKENVKKIQIKEKVEMKRERNGREI